jgi:DNA-directed RNA polymerase I, II, and III subunit RPABC2
MNDDKYGDDDVYEKSDSSDDEDDDINKIIEIKKPKMLLKKPKIEDDEDYEDDDEDNDDDEDDDDDLDDDDEADEAKIAQNIFTKSNESIKNVYEMSDGDDDDDEEEEDDNYLQKLDENVKQNIISEFHPEIQFHNSDEVESLSQVFRVNGRVEDPFHKTLPFLTKYEKARILGERAKQLNAGAQPFIPVEPNVIDGYLIALKELEEKKIPFIIKRPLPNGACEYWKLQDLEIIV